MGLFSSKIAIGVLAGGFTLAGAGLLFNGTQTLQDASTYVQDAGNRLVQYEMNEGQLLEKIGLIKADGLNKLEDANSTIADLEGKKEQLEVEIANLNNEVTELGHEVTNLQAELQSARIAHEDTKAQLQAKIEELNAKSKELSVAKKKINELEGLLVFAYNKAKEADGHIAQLEAEVLKANEEVEAHGEVVEEVKGQTEDAQPLTQEEIDAIDTEIVVVK